MEKDFTVNNYDAYQKYKYATVVITKKERLQNDFKITSLTTTKFELAHEKHFQSHASCPPLLHIPLYVQQKRSSHQLLQDVYFTSSPTSICRCKLPHPVPSILSLTTPPVDWHQPHRPNIPWYLSWNTTPSR